MLGSGFLTGLLRERHPLVALAILALLIPSLFIAGGLHVHAAPAHAGAGVVICTEDGPQLAGLDRTREAPAGHDLQCLSICVHGLSSSGVAANAAAIVPQPADSVAGVAVPRDDDVRPARSGLHISIRAPPSHSV